MDIFINISITCVVFHLLLLPLWAMVLGEITGWETKTALRVIIASVIIPCFLLGFGVFVLAHTLLLMYTVLIENLRADKELEEEMLEQIK